MIQDTDMNADFHNGPNLGLEPTTPMKEGEAMKQDDEVMAALLRSRTVAMKWAARARIPECAKFSDIAQDLDFVIGEILALREELSKMRAEPSDEEIDAIAASMPDGAGGMLKQWGYRQFARALLARYGAQPAQAQRHEFDDCTASPTGKHSESWFANGDCEYCKAGAQPNAPLFYAQAPAADAHPGYAGVTVWVGDMKCTMTVPAPVLGSSRCDALLECFQKARHAIDAARRVEGEGE